MFELTPTWPNVDFRQLFMWIEQSHIWLFRLNITFGWLQKLNPGYEICIISYQVNLSSEVSAMFNSLMPSLNIRSLPFVVFLGGFPSRCQNSTPQCRAWGGGGGHQHLRPIFRVRPAHKNPLFGLCPHRTPPPPFFSLPEHTPTG